MGARSAGTRSAGTGGRRRLLYLAVALLYGLHADFWLWHEGERVLGLPAGLAYHLAYCAAAALVMAALAAWAWPMPAAAAEEAAENAAENGAEEDAANAGGAAGKGGGP